MGYLFFLLYFCFAFIIFTAILRFLLPFGSSKLIAVTMVGVMALWMWKPFRRFEAPEVLARRPWITRLVVVAIIIALFYFSIPWYWREYQHEQDLKHQQWLRGEKQESVK